ncbi:hypothetical protein LSAT2_021760 [Lamellibrachia satsuma]|nr:hypothetical protein LSAT2_021760 [Lamellibrachia satsuma]
MYNCSDASTLSVMPHECSSRIINKQPMINCIKCARQIKHHEDYCAFSVQCRDAVSVEYATSRLVGHHRIQRRCS